MTCRPITCATSSRKSMRCLYITPKSRRQRHACAFYGLQRMPIEVELYAYILERDFGEFLAAQEDVLLQ